MQHVKNRSQILYCYTLNAPKKHHIVDKSQYLIICLIIGCICSCLVPIKLNNLQHYVISRKSWHFTPIFISLISKFNYTSISKAIWLENPLNWAVFSRKSRIRTWSWSKLKPFKGGYSRQRGVVNKVINIRLQNIFIFYIPMRKRETYIHAFELYKTNIF